MNIIGYLAGLTIAVGLIGYGAYLHSFQKDTLEAIYYLVLGIGFLNLVMRNTPTKE